MGLNRKDELLLLVAVSGELPADWIGIAVGSESYGAALITRLKKEGMLRQRKKMGCGVICCLQRPNDICWSDIPRT